MTAPFIMLVDDEVSFVEITAKRLVKRNIKTITAFNAEDCLEKLQKNKDLDVVVLDIKMPGMDGVDALKEIKTVSPLVEVIMLTGHATIELAIDAMKLGAHDFLMKPVEIEELALKIQQAAERKQQQEEKIQKAYKEETLAKYGPFSFT